MKVPLLDLKAQYASLRDEIVPAVEAVLESQHFINGPEVAQLEEEVARYSACAAAVGVSSGTDALLCSLMALEIGLVRQQTTVLRQPVGLYDLIARRHLPCVGDGRAPRGWKCDFPNVAAESEL